MLQAGRCLFTLLFLVIAIVNAQVDPSICTGGATQGQPDPRWRLSTDRFEIVTELVSGSEVLEISQAFTTTRDAIAMNSIELGQSQFYWNFDTNEQFLVFTVVFNKTAGKQCVRKVVNSQSQTSVFVDNTLYLKPSILLGFGPTNKKNNNWSIQYLRNDTIRGYPVDIFTSCFFVPDIKATVSVTYYVINENLFLINSADNQSLLIQFDVTIKNSMNKADQYTYNVFRYVPNPNNRELRQALETPAGVYCNNRDPGLPVPKNIPDRVSSNTEAFIPEANMSIISTHALYDTEFQFTLFDVWYPNLNERGNWIHYREIHDFGVGLTYRYNQTSRECTVIDIVPGGDAVTVDGQTNVFQMGSPQHLFLLDDVDYQYTGEKQCRDRVWCHVWIGERVLPNNTVEHREWYWAFSINDEPLTQWIPMKLVLKTLIGGIPTTTYELNVFNFRRNPFTVFEIDNSLADCYRALGPSNNYNLGVLSFRIANEKNYPVYENLNYLRFHIWETLLFTMFVRPTRLSHLIVDKDDKDIIVTFTLLDAPPRYGPVEVLYNETSFDRLVGRLSNIINSEGLVFRARTSDNKQVILRARPNSLNTEFKSVEEVRKKTESRAAVFWGIFIPVGIIVGIIFGICGLGLLAKKN